MPSITLKNIPEEVYKEIRRVQAEEMVSKNMRFSQESAVYKIIKSTLKSKEPKVKPS